MAQTDREALIAFYNATDGANWKQQTNWGSGAPLSDWYGVKANDQGRVVKLFLSSNNLRGPIPEELGKLTAVKELYLNRNKLSGPIPPELGNLAALKELRLSGNQLTGPIPEELGKLTAVKKLYLSGNKLSGPIPAELGTLRELRELWLDNNELTGPIPPELGKLAALETLRLRWNQLSGHIPPQLGDLGALQDLDLSYNKLDGHIPPELGALSELRQLALFNNKLTGAIPAQLGALNKLAGLHLSDNQLSGPIPPQLGDLRRLRALMLGNNQLSGLWDMLGGGEAGAKAVLCVSGTLPAALASLLDNFDRIDRCDGYEEGLELSPNPWQHPHEAIVGGGMPAVRRYFEAIFRGRPVDVTRPLKVVIIGKETVGKTSLRRSIKTRRPDMTRGGGVDSTVHVDVEYHELDGHPIRMFDCAGQVVYYGLLQLFLTRRAVYLLVWNAEEASKMDELDLEDLAIAPWLRAVTMCLPSSYRDALEMLEELALPSGRTPIMTRATLDEKWKARAGELGIADVPVGVVKGAMAGAILVRKWEGGLVEYGSYVFLDVQWFAKVLDPLFCHKRDSHGNVYLVGKGEEQGLFSLSLDYDENKKALAVEVSGRCEEVHAWRTLSKVLSVTIKMLSEFPGLQCEATFFCPRHENEGMAITTTDARPGSRLIGESYFCSLCQGNHEAGKDVLAVALQVVGYSDEEFFDARLRGQFSEKAEQVALWPGSNFEAADSASSQTSPSSPAPRQTNPV
eukprot:g13180.t1